MILVKLLLLLLIVSLVSAQSSGNDTEWDRYKNHSKLKYSRGTELTEKKHKKNFLKQLEKVKKCNEHWKHGELTYKSTIYEFSHFDESEFLAKKTGLDVLRCSLTSISHFKS